MLWIKQLIFLVQLIMIYIQSTRNIVPNNVISFYGMIIYKIISCVYLTMKGRAKLNGTSDLKKQQIELSTITDTFMKCW